MKNARVGFGKTVRRLRQERGISQEAFAAAAKIGRSYMGRIERGTVNISIDNIQKIVKALGLTLARFFAEVDSDL
jgi:transcriptional regulator with XRE-family HTH domain